MDVVHFNERNNLVTFGLKFKSVEAEDDQGTYSRCVGVQVCQLNNYYVGELAEIQSRPCLDDTSSSRKYYTYETIKQEIKAKRDAKNQLTALDIAPIKAPVKNGPDSFFTDLLCSSS